MKINNIDDNYSERVVNRFAELCQNGKIFYPDEIRIFQILQDKYNPMSISDYARFVKKNYKIIRQQIDSGKLPYFVFAGQIFVLKSLIPKT